MFEMFASVLVADSALVNVLLLPYHHEQHNHVHELRPGHILVSRYLDAPCGGSSCRISPGAHSLKL